MTDTTTDIPQPEQKESPEAIIREALDDLRDGEAGHAEETLLRYFLANAESIHPESKPSTPDDDADRMRAMLARIAYPSRGTPDETADINAFAAEIQAAWSLESLTANA